MQLGIRNGCEIKIAEDAAHNRTTTFTGCKVPDTQQDDTPAPFKVN
jgi:hypothetical protein